MALKFSIPILYCSSENMGKSCEEPIKQPEIDGDVDVEEKHDNPLGDASGLLGNCRVSF